MEEVAWFWGVATCVKLLLVPTYHSTDFEVHRHWLALTSSLPLVRWYSDTSSQWTLDYPPLFAYFELLLSLPASLLDPTIVHLVAGQNYSAPSALLFQRLSVAAADLALLLGVRRLARRLPPFRRRVALALLLWSPALFIVDHIHFQYNGFLLGILLLSLSFLHEGRDLAGGIAFAVLICSKHLFLVGAPVYFVYLLRHYCRGGFGKAVGRFLAMGSAVAAVFAVAFGPFFYHGQEPIIRNVPYYGSSGRIRSSVLGSYQSSQASTPLSRSNGEEEEASSPVSTLSSSSSSSSYTEDPLSSTYRTRELIGSCIPRVTRRFLYTKRHRDIRRVPLLGTLCGR